MTPKEKAKELVDKMLDVYNIDDIAIDCALIAVDEILDSRPAITDSQIEYQNYWEEVKTEISNL